MTDRELLLAAILANPDEDTPRLAYADEIEEEEPEHAEFIRVQCKIARMHPGDLMCDRTGDFLSHAGGAKLFTPRCRCKPCSLVRREYMLGRRFIHWYWCKGIPPGTQKNYRRGFIEHITCTAADWLTHADAIVKQHPVRKVRLTTRVQCGVAGLENEPGVLERWFSARWPGIEFELPRLTSGTSATLTIMGTLLAESTFES